MRGITNMEKLDRIAKSIVGKNLSVKKGEQVVIHTWDHTLDAAGAFVYASRARGANPVVETLIERDYFRSVAELDAKQLSAKNLLALATAETENVDIFLAGPRDPRIFQKVSYEKMNAVGDQNLQKKIYDLQKKRKVRTAYVNIGQATPERAAAYGIDYGPWLNASYDALLADPAGMARTAKPVMDAVKRGREGRLISSDGSALKFRLARRAATLDDGVLRAADLKRGDIFVHLPSGVVFFAPLEGSAEGKIEYDMSQPSRGMLIKGAWASVKRGALAAYGARENEGELKGLIDAQHAKGMQLGYLTVGVNPGAKPFFIDHQMAMGMVGAHFGNNAVFGGKIKGRNYHYGGFSQSATLEIDGKTVVGRGKIVDG